MKINLILLVGTLRIIWNNLKKNNLTTFREIIRSFILIRIISKRFDILTIMSKDY